MELLKRKDWGAKQPKSSFSKLSDIKGLVVHWSAYPTALSKTEELTQIKQIQDLHQNDRGWNDIAYNFCVGDSGTIYEARGFENRSAAQGGNTRDEINYNNRHYVAVCWLGGSNPDDQPSKEAVAAVKDLWRKVGGELRPHSSFKATNCPGNMWRQWIDNRLPFVPKEAQAAEVVKEATRFTLIKKTHKEQNVEPVQIMLNFINKKQIPNDGDFGNKTLAAVVLFQKKHKLTPDGIVGQLTYAKLIEANRSSNKERKYTIE